MFSTRVTFRGKHSFYSKLTLRAAYFYSFDNNSKIESRAERNSFFFFFFFLILRTILLFNENNKFRIFKFTISFLFFLATMTLKIYKTCRKMSKIVVIDFFTNIFFPSLLYFSVNGIYLTIHRNNTESQSCVDLSFKI